MLRVSRRVASATLGVALAVLPVTAVPASPVDAEEAPSAWSVAVEGLLAGLLDLLGFDGPDAGTPPVGPTATAAPSGPALPGGTQAGPWWDPNGGTVDLLSRPGGECGPWWDPNG